MGQAVSLNSCISGGSVVRVMRTDGEFDQFDFPCIAAEVMLQHPGHLVVHCTKVDKSSIGQRTKITIMIPDQPMLPGQPYMLYPIPDSHKKSLARSKSFSMIKKKMESSSTPTVTPAEKRQGRRKALRMIFTRLNLATYVAGNIREDGEPTPPLLDAGGSSHRSAEGVAEGNEIEEENENKKSLSVQLPNPESLNFSWRPRLSMIPESPLGFHSQPGTPRGLYKLDGLVPPSPLSIGSRSPAYVAADRTNRCSGSMSSAPAWLPETRNQTYGVWNRVRRRRKSVAGLQKSLSNDQLISIGVEDRADPEQPETSIDSV